MALFQIPKISAVQVIKGGILLLPVLLFFLILNNHFLFTPTFTYTYQPGHPRHVVGPRTPSEILRTSDPTMRWRINTDTLTLVVTIPRLIEAINLQVRLDPGTAKLVKLNAAAKTGGDFSNIVSSAVLDKLDWPYVTDGQTTLWMRDKAESIDIESEYSGSELGNFSAAQESIARSYKSYEEFRLNPPSSGEIAVAEIDPMSFVHVDEYTPLAGTITFPHSFRGRHRLYVYAADEDIKIQFNKIDLNRKKDADTMKVLVARADRVGYRDRKWIKNIAVRDDGVIGATNVPGRAQPVEIFVPNAPAGMYYIDIVTTEDVVINNLTSAQSNIAFINKMFFADGPAYGQKSFTASKVLTNGTHVTFMTSHEQGQQDITINRTKYTLQKLKTNVTAKGLSGTTTFDIAKGDLSVISDGLLTLSPANIISGGAVVADLSGEPDFSQVKYVVAPYVPRLTGPITFEQHYQLTGLALQGKNLYFSVNSPGLVGGGKTLGLKDIRATLIRGPFPWQKVREKISGWLSSAI